MPADPGRRPAPGRRPELARGPVYSAMIAVAVVLTVFSARYGYHRDELYFRMLPNAWGYVDEPPLTPLIAHLFRALVADEPWAIRLPATAATVASVYVLALITREFGGGRRAQTLCAWAYGFAATPMIMGHALLTSTIDLPVWPLVLLFISRAQLRRQPRWWLAAGLVVGLSTYNKLLVAVLLIALGAGLALVGPRRALWSRWVAGASGLALVIGLPNLLYQATHGWPQLSMGRALADHHAGSVHVVMWPLLILLLGPPLVPIWIAGLIGLSRRARLAERPVDRATLAERPIDRATLAERPIDQPEWRDVRFVAAAFPVLLVLVFAMGAQPYYEFGLLAVLFAVGCVPTAGWIGSAPRVRRPVVVAFVGLNAAVGLVLGLPLIPLSALGATPVPAINQVARDTVGWPTYVAQVAAVYHAEPVVDRTRTVIVASNYGEAGAVDRYRSRFGLPRVFSGQNQLYFLGAPPTSATVAVVVGGQVDQARSLFERCVDAGHLDNNVGVDNEEQGEPIAVCRMPIGGWPVIWPQLRHED